MIFIKTDKGKVDIFSTIKTNNDSQDEILCKPKSKINYILCFTARSGSTMTMSLFEKTHLLGNPSEFINPRGVMQKYLSKYPASNIFEYFDLLRRDQVSNNGIFGIKSSFPDLEPLIKSGLIGKLLNPVKFIYLTRRDIILQAISLYILQKSGRGYGHAVKSRPVQTSVEIEYNEEQILKRVDRLIQQKLQWERFFSLYSVEPLRITYEDILEDANKIVQSILAFMGEDITTSVDLTMSETLKIGTDRNQTWADRIRAKYVL